MKPLLGCFGAQTVDYHNPDLIHSMGYPNRRKLHFLVNSLDERDLDR